MRIGIVGRRGTAFYTGLRAIPGVQLTALCDLDQDWLQQEAKSHAIPIATPNFDHLLDQVDAVVVATPMQWHAPMAIQALQLGKHVMSEVTACVSPEECWRLLDAALASKATYFFAENYCYLPENVLVRELVKQGHFGEITYGEGEYLHDVKPLHHRPDGTLTWRGYWQVGQKGNTYPTHSIGPVMQWFRAADPTAKVESVVCLGSGIHTDPEHPHDDTTITLVKLTNGKLIRLRLDMMSNRPHQMTYYALQGTHGVYECSRTGWEGGKVWFGDNPPPGPHPEQHRTWQPLAEHHHLLPDHWKSPPPDAASAGHGGGDYWVVKDFIDAARGERPPAIDVYDALEWTAVGLYSQVSIENQGARIKIPDFRDQKQRPVWLDG
jgi:predicted dehydrogenase